jgi:thioredoxin 1
MKRIAQSLLLVFLLFTACTNSGAQGNGGVAKTISVQEYEAKMAALLAHGTLVDVRTPQEFASGHLRGAENIDFNSSDFQELVSKLDKTKPTFIYCKSGGRSGRALTQLVNMGFVEVYNLDGGITEWRSANKPISPTTK